MLLEKDAADEYARLILLIAQNLTAYEIAKKTTIMAPRAYGNGKMEEIARPIANPPAIQPICWIRNFFCWFIW
jgi:hypothetical protein